MLDFHQSETCEGIIQHLELREGATRHDVRVRDIGNHTSPDARVEMTFRLIRGAAFASLKAPLRPVRAPVGPTDVSEEPEASGR
jgi:hypothetical protein